MSLNPHTSPHIIAAGPGPSSLAHHHQILKAKEEEKSPHEMSTGSSGQEADSSNGHGQNNGKQSARRTSAEGKEKSKRVAACDVCRMRKVKCVKSEDGPQIDGRPQRCQGCIELNRDCSYNYMPKKPGPPNPYARPPPSQQQPSIDRFAPFPPTPQGGYRNMGLSGFDRNGSVASSGANYPMSPPQMPFSFMNGTQQSVPKSASDPTMVFQNHQQQGLPDFTGGFTQQMTGQSRRTNSVEQASPRTGGGQDFSPAKSAQGGMNGLNAEDNLFLPWIVGVTPPAFPGGPGGMSGTPVMPSSGLMNTHGLPDGLAELADASALAWGSMTGGSGDMGHSGMGEPGLGLDTHSTNHSGMSGGAGMITMNGGERQASGSISGNNTGSWQQQQQPATSNGSVHISTPVNTFNENNLFADQPVLEDATSWSTIMTFLSLYHEHLYPLLPLMHWPSFSQQLICRHDRKDITFRAFVLSLVAYSILQLPRSVIPERFSQQELLTLHRRCHKLSQKLQPKVYEPAELVHISTLYCDHIYLGSMGKDNAANVVLAEAMRLAIAMGLHDETVANNLSLNEIERETRRRVFWVLYGSDRTIAALISCPMLLSDEDIFVGDILAVDDDLITAAGAFQQPAGRTPILAGFLHVTKIFRLLSRVLQLVRRRARPNSLENIDDGLVDPRNLIQSLQNLLDDLPPALRINGQVEEPRSRSDTVAFDTCKANILVTQVLVRFAIYQYAILKQQGRPDQCLDELTEDVLRRLHAMSSESLAANGESIRHKVLFIASSLLNKYPSDNAGHDHVSEFLGVYNKILTNQSTTGVDANGNMETGIPIDMATVGPVA